MNNKFQIITDIDEASLECVEQFVYNHPNGNFFQSTKAYNFFRSLPSYKPALLVAKEDDEIVGTLLAVVIKEGNGINGYFSRRCIVWGGPLVKDENPEVYSGLLNELNKKMSSMAIYTEFRNFFDLSCKKKLFEKSGYQFNEHLNFLVSTSSIEDTKSRLSKSKVKQIKKTIKNGVGIVQANCIEDVKAFFEILNNLYKEKVKKPLAPFIFFQKFFEDKSLGKYLLIKKDDQVIGGIMCPVYRDKIYEWFVCGLDGKFKNIYPSILATWAPIEYAATNGLKYFDFMGAGKPNEDYGVREFKSKFGGELVNYGRFIKVNNKPLFNLGKLGLKILKKIK